MAQCDAFENKVRASRAYAPYLLDVQADLLRDLDTRVVVPLVRADLFGRPIRRLHPVFDVDGVAVVMATHLIAGVSRDNLGRFKISLADHRTAIVAAIDVIISGV